MCCFFVKDLGSCFSCYLLWFYFSLIFNVYFVFFIAVYFLNNNKNSFWSRTDIDKLLTKKCPSVSSARDSNHNIHSVIYRWNPNTKVTLLSETCCPTHCPLLFCLVPSQPCPSCPGFIFHFMS